MKEFLIDVVAPFIVGVVAGILIAVALVFNIR